MPFNVPPNWPAPPHGWEPDRSWRPDPSWPPAPQGWQFWTEDTTVDQSVWTPDLHTPAPPITVQINGIRNAAAESLSPARGLIATARQRGTYAARRVAHTTTRFLNPIRLLLIAIAVAGLYLFIRVFVALRFTPRWNYEGWMWHGMWPLLGMFAGIVAAVIGAAGARRWDHGRWTARKLSRRSAAQKSPAH